MLKPGLQNIPIGQLKTGRKLDRFPQMLPNVSKGIMNPILVRPDGTIIDGLARWEAAKLYGLTEVPCRVIDPTSEQLAEASMIAPVVRIPAGPVEFARQLQRLMIQNRLTADELAPKIDKSKRWVTERLTLLNLCDEAAAAVDEKGTVCFANALVLATLTHDKQREMLPFAESMSVDVFEAQVRGV